MTSICIAGGPRTGKTTLAEALERPTSARHRLPMGAVFDPPTGESASFATSRSAYDAVPVRHTDDLQHLGWSEASEAAARWFDAPGPWIVEGVAAPRALRKWLAAHPDGKPCDVLYWLTEPHVTLTTGQVAMAKGCSTVMAEIYAQLVARGVLVRGRGDPGEGSTTGPFAHDRNCPAFGRFLDNRTVWAECTCEAGNL